MTFINYGLPIILVAMVIWGMPSAWGTHLQRSLIAVFVNLAAAFLLSASAIGPFFDRLTGIPTLGVMLLQHLEVLATLSFFVDFVYALLNGEERAFRPRHGLAIAFGLTMTVLFFGVVPHSDADLTYAHIPGRGWVLLYRGLFYAVMLWAALLTSQLMVRKAVQTRREGRTSAGYVLMAGGCVTGAAFCLWRVGTMFLLDFTGQPTIAWCEDVALVLMCGSTLLIVAGALTPPISSALQTIRATWALHRLRRLWTDLTMAVPKAVLENPPHTLWSEIRARRMGLQLHGRVVEIKDATLALSYYAPPELWGRAREAVHSIGVPADDGDSHAEALWLHAVLALVREGAQARSAASEHGTTDTTDIAQLLRVAAAYRRPRTALT